MHTPLAARIALGRMPTLREPRLVGDSGDWVLWLEQRPQEKGRTTALIRRWGAGATAVQELTPAPINLRSRVHDYGGGVLAQATDGQELMLAWIDDRDGCVWFQTWQGLDQSEANPLLAHGPARRLSRPGAPLADGQLDPFRRRWLGVMEDDGRDWLVSLQLDQEDQTPDRLHQPADFAGYIALSPRGDRLAWVEWQQPNMPWDNSQLWGADLDSEGRIITPIALAGSEGTTGAEISVFQPLWLPDGRLVVAEDGSGWWNLLRSTGGTTLDSLQWERPWPMEAETAMPQWVYGMRTSAWDGRQLLAAVCREGCWQLNRLSEQGTVQTLDQPFDDLAGLHAQGERAVAIASNSTTGQGLLEIDLSDGHWHHHPAAEPALSAECISVAEPLWFEGSQGRRTHAWYYPPSAGSTERPPLLVKSHSGPTAMARRGLSLGIQYWTSRGWGVVDVNYGGSTGFGRAYRERLNGGWGIVDVEDCAAAAHALIAAGRAHPDQIAIEGGSAGGFTTLACLCFTETFRVGACRYAVSDLTAMATDTHRFEARYADRLVGTWPQERERYEARSPLLHAERIHCPVIFFQGDKDKVVPPEQTERMATALRANGLPVEVHSFPNEGHGFRDSQVQISVLEATERFFRTHLGLNEG
jgi:dipeptidyl aminopeptidase/acylaminoacyl peptidase